jgi:anhydro-N-acetylmuramic acid kinase
MMNWLGRILDKKERLVVGLMSGTSMDGVDAVLVRIKGHGLETKIEVINFICLPYEPSLLRRLEGVISKGSTSEVSDLNFLVGEAFSEAAIAVIKGARFSTSDIDLIGSHGQTVYHNPPSLFSELRVRQSRLSCTPKKKAVPSTIQIGELDVIAERTGITTIGDFRTRDLAAGGEGAPLIPYVDYILFHKPGRISIAQNIGGIANATVITERLDDVIAFDTGPGNMLMDNVVSLATNGRKRFDQDGSLALKGSINKELLGKLLSNPFFSKPPPKSTGAEFFGKKKASALYTLVKKKRISLSDLIATLSELTIESIARSYERFVFSRWSVNEVILSGGGARNPVLVERLKKRLGDLELSTSDIHGISVDVKEALGFAVLANELISGNFTNLPAVTGARKHVPLGKIALGGKN